MFAFLSPSKASQITLLLPPAHTPGEREAAGKHPGKGALVLCLLQTEIILKWGKKISHDVNQFFQYLLCLKHWLAFQILEGRRYHTDSEWGNYTQTHNHTPLSQPHTPHTPQLLGCPCGAPVLLLALPWASCPQGLHPSRGIPTLAHACNIIKVRE